MSGSEEEANRFVGTKRRRLQNACDGCRKRKIKCDSAKMSNNVCSNCIAFRCECTHMLATIKKKRGPPVGKPRGTRAVRTIVAAILSTTTPFAIPETQTGVLQLLVDLATHITSLETELDELKCSKTSCAEGFAPVKLSESTSFPTPGSSGSVLDSADPLEVVANNMERLSLNQSRHFGPSSTLALVKTAMDIEDALPQDAQIPSSQSSQFVGCRRPEFWAIYPWQIPIEESPPPLEFPEEDLIQDLIRLFFTNCAQFIPVLHRPTFERSVAEGLHFNDRHFGHLLLAICALASRYSNDPRIFVKGSTQEFSCGWQWFRQIKLFRNSYVTVPSIYEVQVCVISVLFLQGSSTPEACWLLVSHGIRLAQDQGAHRIKSNPNNPKPKLSDELWKRTFWMLYVIDTIVSAFSGRPRATTNDDFDLDLPVENDDDFWEVPDPEIAFRQPPGRALVISYGSAIVKLMDILGTAQRTIYATRRSDIWIMIGLSDAEANQRILSELDASLNDWIDKIPEHLKWDPNRENMVFFHQSVLLYVSYYWVQILVHKPFITRPGTDTDLSFPSLAICVNAARSAVHVMEVQQRRGFLPWPNVVLSLYSSAVVLVLNAWRGKHFKTSSETSKEMIEVYKCIRMIRSYEKRWQNSGTYCDVIRQLISISDLEEKPTVHPEDCSHPQCQRGPSPTDSTTTHYPSSPDPYSGQQHQQQHHHHQGLVEVDHTATTSNDPLSDVSFGSSSQPTAETGTGTGTEARTGYIDMDPVFSLPLYSNELGNLPLHQTFDPFGDSQAWVEYEQQQHAGLFSNDAHGTEMQQQDVLPVSGTRQGHAGGHHHHQHHQQQYHHHQGSGEMSGSGGGGGGGDGGVSSVRGLQPSEEAYYGYGDLGASSGMDAGLGNVSASASGAWSLYLSNVDQLLNTMNTPTYHNTV